MSVRDRRLQQAMFAMGSLMNRPEGGALASILSAPANAAGGDQGDYSTANPSTYSDITNSSFSLAVTRPSFLLYLIHVCAHRSIGAQTGYVRGNIVGFDVTARCLFDGVAKDNGFMWYIPIDAGPIPAGEYTVKLQAATDANTTTVHIDQFAHVILLIPL